ncbi:hypothetical protein [Sunxiuqinia elliptica]|nr:hypothetical protein [Sunxiuqinia elliptica]
MRKKSDSSITFYEEWEDLRNILRTSYNPNITYEQFDYPPVEANKFYQMDWAISLNYIFGGFSYTETAQSSNIFDEFFFRLILTEVDQYPQVFNLGYPVDANTTITYDSPFFNRFSLTELGTLNTAYDMELTKSEFKEIAEKQLDAAGSQITFTNTELKTFDHNDPENPLIIDLTPNQRATCFIKKINLYIKATGTSYSLKITHEGQNVNTILKQIPEGVEGTNESGGYFADKIEIKGNVSGQILYYKAFVSN